MEQNRIEITEHTILYFLTNKIMKTLSEEFLIQLICDDSCVCPSLSSAMYIISSTQEELFPLI